MKPSRHNKLSRLAEAVSSVAATVPLVRVGGVVTEVTPGHCRISGLPNSVRLGDHIVLATGERGGPAEVIRIDQSGATVKPFSKSVTSGLGTTAWHAGRPMLRPTLAWKGRVISPLGEPIDGAGPLPHGPDALSVKGDAPAPLRRQRIKTALKTGVRAIDLFAPICAGQRIGVFAGSGIGKSTLLAMMAASQSFTSTVVALVGERGREVREFLEDSLAASRERVIAIVATGDESPMMRRQAPEAAMCIAEYLRDKGEHVLLIVDSITRYAHAARDVALAAGEPPVARGYAPSVFSELPKLLERAGPGEFDCGSITGIFSVLVDGDDHNDPVADSIRGTLDGHIVLDRGIAEQGRYPAIDLLISLSRLAPIVWSIDERALIAKLRAMISRYEETRDLRLMGGYTRGSDTDLDRAVELVPKLYDALKQSPSDPASSDAFREIAQALAP